MGEEGTQGMSSYRTASKRRQIVRAASCILVIWLCLDDQVFLGEEAKNKKMAEAIAQLQDKDFRVRIIAARQLAEIGTGAREAEPALLQAIKAKDFNVSKDLPELVTALIKIGVDPKPLIEDGVLKADHIL